jgi:hypothetical protein
MTTFDHIYLLVSFAYPDHFDSDPDSTSHFDAASDPDLTV